MIPLCGILMYFLLYDFCSVMQMLCRCFLQSNIEEVRNNVKFLLNTLPLKQSRKHLQYSLEEVEVACQDGNINRYLSQMKSSRVDMLKFINYGLFKSKDRHQDVRIFEILDLQPYQYGGKFEDIWPSQLLLIDKLLVRFVFCLTCLDDASEAEEDSFGLLSRHSSC